MKNKVLIKLVIPELDRIFDIFIPVNELVWKIKKLIIKSVSDLSGGSLNTEEEYVLVNKLTSKVYNNNDIILNTDIRNATELILISTKRQIASVKSDVSNTQSLS